MQGISEALNEIKSLYPKVLGTPAPELGPHQYVPFPPGVDPIKHAVDEVQRLEKYSEQMEFAPWTRAWSPTADSFTTKDGYIVRLDIPGVPRDDLKVFVIGGECVVRGERKPSRGSDDNQPVALERPWGPFERRFVVPIGARVKDLKASYTDGVLELRIPMEGIEVPKEQTVRVD